MALLEYAEAELRRAGWFDKHSEYAGMVGDAVMAMMKQFSDEGHSGYSAQLVLGIFKRVASFRPLTPLDNPLKDGEFHDVSAPSGTMLGTTLQSTRLSSLFSEDCGKTWYDIDKELPRVRRWLLKLRLPISRRAYVSFPYLPR